VALPAFAAERRAAMDLYLLPAGRSAINPQQRRENDGTDRQTDGRTPDRYKDPAPRTMWAVPMNR